MRGPAAAQRNANDRRHQTGCLDYTTARKKYFF
jgi:hypothetical protein